MPQADMAPKLVHLEYLQPEGWAPILVHLGVLLRWLHHYPYRAEATNLAQSFKEGFCIPYNGQYVHVMPRNLKSINVMEDVVRNKVKNELEGRHPHNSWRLPNLHLLPLGVVPKKTPGEFRLVHHLFILPLRAFS